MAEFTINSQPITNTTAISKLAGDLDNSGFSLLEDEFNKLLESGILGLILDISGLDSLSSAGLGAVINLGQILNERKGKLVVATPRPKILGLLEMLRLGEALTIADSQEQARKLVSSIR